MLYKVSFLILVISSCFENIVLNGLLGTFNRNSKKEKKKIFCVHFLLDLLQHPRGTIAKFLA